LLRELLEIDAFVGKVSLNHDLKGFSITPSHFAYLKICEDCINNCSYCIIPKIKGKFLSLDVNSVLKRAERFNKDRISELNIIGQDITGYGIDLYGAAKLDELLKGISRIASQIGWIRLLYLYPSRITDRLLELIRDDPKVCKYLDLPIQHINDRILNLMHRQTSKKDILNLIDKVRKTIPGVAIRTSLIVGFPSETDREFKELLGFIEDVRFERMGAFIYSREEGTEAFCFKKQIPQKIKVERFNALMSSQQGISREINQRFLGRIIDVLIDDRHKGTYVGRSQYDAPEVDGVVYVKSIRTLRPGEFVKVKVTDTLEYDLVGEAF
jgi:ribosomal protein S12 methylthiotransferase